MSFCFGILLFNIFLSFQFLDEVAEIQTKAAEEERKRLEAELADKQKKTFFRKKSQVEVS